MAGWRSLRGTAGLVAAALLAGCGSSSWPTGPFTTVESGAPRATALLEARSLTSQDLDADGIVDLSRYAFPAVDLVPGLALDRTVELRRADGEGRITLTYRYSNHGSSRIETTHRIVIPKSVAASVDELTFSHPPSRVIEADPVVEEDVTLDYGEVEEFVASAAEEIGNAGSTGKDANAAWLVLAVGVEACREMKPGDRDVCLVSLVRDVARDLPPSDLAPVCREVLGSAFSGACLAIATRNPAECRKVTDAYAWRDPCIRVYADFACAEHADKAGRDRCRIGLAIDGESITTCDDIADKDTAILCAAGVAKNPDLCARISDKGLADACSAAIRCGQSVVGLTGGTAGPGSPGASGCASAAPSRSESSDSGSAPGLPATVRGAFADYPSSQFTLTLGETGASGTGRIDKKEGNCPAIVDFTFTGEQTSPATWSGTVKVVETSTASSQDALCQLGGDPRPVTVPWMLAFTPSGPVGSVEGWGELRFG